MPEIHLLSGERNREYVLDYSDETLYLVFAPEPLRSIALLAIDTGLRMGEALALEWRDVHLTAHGSQWGYVFVREGKSKNARRAVPLTRRAHEMPEQRVASAPTVFADESGNPYNVSYLDHLHAKTRKALKLPKEYVLHSLRDTYLTRLGLAGAAAFEIMRLAGHSSVSVSQRYVHPTPQAMEDAVSRLDTMNTRSLKSKAEGDDERSSEARAAPPGRTEMGQVAPQLTPTACPTRKLLMGA